MRLYVIKTLVIIVALVRDYSLLMPQVWTDERCLFGGIFLLLNLVDYTSKSYPMNNRAIKICYPSLERQTFIYPT